MQTACHAERSETSLAISSSGNARRVRNDLRLFAALRMTKPVYERWLLVTSVDIKITQGVKALE
jgi:hypothetical protein